MNFNLIVHGDQESMKPTPHALLPERGCREHQSAADVGFFTSACDATDATDNGLAIGQLQRIDKATTSPPEATQRVCERLHNPSAGDKMAGINRILQGSLVQQHGAGSRLYLTLGSSIMESKQ